MRDSRAAMGLGCTREQERAEAARGLLDGAPPAFQPGQDVKSAGVLFALPALLCNGLLTFSEEHFRLPRGYYSLSSLLIVLAFAALLRVKSLEGVRYCDPGELGKAAGLDRIPEVRTLRRKVAALAECGGVGRWSRELARMWMEQHPGMAGTLYADGHMRVYHGRRTKLPKHYVARERLCLRGVPAYWVNDRQGRPFFAVSYEVDPKMVRVLREDIVPRLLKDVPGQPSGQELAEQPWLPRFWLVFDREGYSPVLFRQLWQRHRIACLTYRRAPGDPWREEEFSKVTVSGPGGEQSEMLLAERGSYLDHGKVWVREVRRLIEKSGHQTPIVCTDYLSDAAQIAAKMFARWSQENFFKYMMQHFGIDRLVDYQLEGMDETVRVVNPRHRELDSQVRSLSAKLARKQQEFARLELKGGIAGKRFRKRLRRKAELRGQIEAMQQEVGQLKAQRKQTPRHIPFRELPRQHQFKKLKSGPKQLVDTIKMIAYRAETAMANLVREGLGKKKDEARSIVRQIFETDADLEPDEEKGILKVRLHNLANPRNNRQVKKLCQILNSSRTEFPGSNLRLVYDLVSSQNPSGQEF